MKVIKVFETSFDICDVEKLYQPISTILMEELKAKYEKRCYKSSYIIEIKDIIHYSSNLSAQDTILIYFCKGFNVDFR
jgi:hypothetical protein